MNILPIKREVEGEKHLSAHPSSNGVHFQPIADAFLCEKALEVLVGPSFFRSFRKSK